MNQPSVNNPIYIKLSKISDKDKIENHQIFTGYTIEGWIVELPKIGEPFRCIRTIRNGIQRLGIFTTSEVENVSEITDKNQEIQFETQNSIYTIVLQPSVKWPFKSLDLTN